MTWTIDKQFGLAYGHRVWTQKLNSEFTENNDCACACRHLHGHEGLVHVFLEAEELKDGMITDFKHLGWLKNFIDDTLDHKFVIDRNDPMFSSLVEDVYYQSIKLQYKNLVNGHFMNNCVKPVFVPGTNFWAGNVVDLSLVESGTPDYEVLEGFFIVDFVPTSENLARWLYHIVKDKMDMLGVKTKEIWWNETPKSRSIYRG